MIRKRRMFPILLHDAAPVKWIDVSQPEGLVWELPFTIQQSGRRFRPRTGEGGALPFDLHEHANLSPTTTYYVKKGGNDGADGLSWETALARPATAFTKGDVDKVIISAGYYYRSECTGGITRSVEVVASGGPVYITNDCIDNLGEFSAVDDHYEATLSTARTLFIVDDAHNPDTFGLPTPLTKMASAAEVDATANSWWQDGLAVYIHTADSRAPNADLHYYTNDSPHFAIANGITVYYENIHFRAGGTIFRCAATSGDPATKIYMQGCSSFGLTIAGVSECIFRDCQVFLAAGDGWNYDARGAVISNGIEIDCSAYDLGAAADHQGSTSHNGCKLLRINGAYHHTTGQNLADVDAATRVWMLGSRLYASAAAVGYYLGGTAWLDTCSITGNTASIQTATGATAYHNNLTYDGTLSGDGTFTEY